MQIETGTIQITFLLRVFQPYADTIKNTISKVLTIIIVHKTKEVMGQEQIKRHYLRDLFSFRQLDYYSYKGKGKRPYKGYIIGVVSASEIVDNGFWNNENLLQQFDQKVKQSTGSRFADALVETANESYVEKQIQKASEESTGKMVLYVPDNSDQIMADLIFHNKSKNRNLDEPTIVLGSSLGTLQCNTSSAKFGSKSFEDVITFSVGDFSYFKETILNKPLVLYFNHEEDDEGEAKDFLSLHFNVNIPVLDIAAVDYIVNGAKWSAEKTGSILPLIEHGVDLYSKQSQLAGQSAEINKTNKKAKWISWITAIVLFSILYSTYQYDISDGGTALLLAVCVLLGMSGKYIGKRINAQKQEAVDKTNDDLSRRSRDIESQIEKVYLSITSTEG